MRTYTIYNKILNVRLTHPKIGLWYTNDLKEAEDMLEACHQYLDAVGLSYQKSKFIMIDAETEEEI